MSETLIGLLESWGVSRAEDQIQYLMGSTIPFAIWETLYVTVLATVFAYAIGLPLGVILVTGEAGGIRPLPPALMKVINVVVNLLRSVPFTILMVCALPLSRLILGTSIGTTATITILSYGAMAGFLGGGGLGAMALLRGHGRQETVVLYVAVILLVILVQIIQSIGTSLAVKTDRRINSTETKQKRRGEQ